jgi:hypothetical protein
MVFSRILSTTFSKISKYNLPFSKDAKRDIFVVLPAIIGGGCGTVSGANSMFNFSKDEHFYVSMLFTTAGVFYGGIAGALSGILWPISIPLIVSRCNITTKNEKN